jgi:hypothetical protein
VSPALWWIALTVPACLVSVWLGIRTVRSLIRTTRASLVASVPLCERQTLPLPSAGDYDLYVEGKRFSRDFGGLDFALADRSGTALPMRRSLLRTQVSSGSRVRLAVRSFRVDAAGDVTLSTTGIRPAQDPENRIVIARPFRAALVAHVLALVGLSIAAIGSLVGTILSAVFAGDSPPAP